MILAAAGMERVSWEVTRACAVACLHCRAESTQRRDDMELSLEQAGRLLERIAVLKPIELWLVGGDPLQRPDLEQVVALAKEMTVGILIANTDRATPARLTALRDAGASLIGIKLDGPDAETHDEFRGVSGSFNIGWAAAEKLPALGMRLRVETLVGPWNFDKLDVMADRIATLSPDAWEWTPALPVGRAVRETLCTAEEMETLFGRMLELRRCLPFPVRLHEAPQVRRYAQQRGEDSQGLTGPDAAHGTLFIGYKGDICPNGYLTVPCGNVTREDPGEVYHNHFFFQRTRDASQVSGKCARCDFLDLCRGGSRARAYIVTGHFTASDPACAFDPGL